MRVSRAQSQRYEDLKNEAGGHRMMPGSNRSLIHDVIAVCGCRNRHTAYYDGDTQAFVCGDCGCKIVIRAGEILPYTTNEEERKLIWVSTNSLYEDIDIN
jgi:hypothetical protein